MEGLQYIILGTSIVGILNVIKPTYLELPSFRFFSGLVLGSSFMGATVMIVNTILS